MIWVTQVAALTARETVDAPNKPLRFWQMIFLSTLNILSIFTFRKPLSATKMLKMFILGRSALLMIIFRSCFLLSQHVQKYGPPAPLPAPFGPDAEDSFRPQEATGQAQRN